MRPDQLTIVNIKYIVHQIVLKLAVLVEHSVGLKVSTFHATDKTLIVQNSPLLLLLVAQQSECVEHNTKDAVQQHNRDDNPEQQIKHRQTKVVRGRTVLELATCVHHCTLTLKQPFVHHCHPTIQESLAFVIIFSKGLPEIRVHVESENGERINYDEKQYNRQC